MKVRNQTFLFWVCRVKSKRSEGEHLMTQIVFLKLVNIIRGLLFLIFNRQGELIWETGDGVYQDYLTDGDGRHTSSPSPGEDGRGSLLTGDGELEIYLCGIWEIYRKLPHLPLGDGRLGPQFFLFQESVPEFFKDFHPRSSLEVVDFFRIIGLDIFL